MKNISNVSIPIITTFWPVHALQKNPAAAHQYSLKTCIQFCELNISIVLVIPLTLVNLLLVKQQISSQCAFHNGEFYTAFCGLPML